MNFTRDQISAVTVHQVKPGAIKVGNETISENVVLFRDIVQRGIALGKSVEARWRGIKRVETGTAPRVIGRSVDLDGLAPPS